MLYTLLSSVSTGEVTRSYKSEKEKDLRDLISLLTNVRKINSLCFSLCFSAEMSASLLLKNTDQATELEQL